MRVKRVCITVGEAHGAEVIKHAACVLAWFGTVGKTGKREEV